MLPDCLPSVCSIADALMPAGPRTSLLEAGPRLQAGSLI